MSMRKPYYLSLYEKALPDSMSLGEKWELAKACGYDGIEISSYLASRRLKFARLSQRAFMNLAAGAPSRARWSKVRERPIAG